MTEAIRPDICIIGGGSAGLSVAAGATQMGARTVLIEEGRMGGDCLNTGCVPSKSLLAAAKVAQTSRTADRYGVEIGELAINGAGVNRYVHSVIDSIAPHDSVERFTKLGCRVVEARAEFVDTGSLKAGGITVRARRFVIATGSRPAVPPIPGLADVPYFTNETIFENTTLPSHLIVVGAGPIGCEMAQAHRRLGSEVTLLELGRILPRDDPDAVEVVRRTFAAEGLSCFEGVSVTGVARAASGITVTCRHAGRELQIDGSHLLIATGRRPNVEGLGLEKAGVELGDHGIKVDSRLRTSNKRIFAAGDVVGGPQFTHVASYHAGIVLKNALFRIPARNSPKAWPWVTYTDPEVTHVGLSEADARETFGDRLRVLRADFADNDRARAEGHTTGFLKAVAGRRGRILGATIVGSHAGELILPWVLAIAKGHRIGDMASVIAPYPTLSEISKRAAGSYFTPALFSERTKRIVRFIGTFG